ncbi:MAG TPA: PIG-L family deacetylase [Steroidobacteraceae bacterium]|nr:PIG-L family deacetylase [Steroidobacteraceae bacterium]
MTGPWRLLAALLIAALPATRAAADSALARMSAISAHDRVLVIAPHPDDETLCCAGLLQQALARGAGVAVVWLTAGDGFELDAMLVEHTLWPGGSAMRRLGAERLREAHAAADRLGVPRSAQFELGYPDRGVLALAGAYFNRPYYSKYTASSLVPYAGALSPGASYTGANLERDLEAVLTAFNPTLVLAAAPEDRHPDHSASGALALRLLERRGESQSLHYWIVHAPGWPRPLGLEPQLPLSPPATAAARVWEAVPLSEAERTRKLAALREHRSQMRWMAPFLEAFVRANEIFARPH